MPLFPQLQNSLRLVAMVVLAAIALCPRIALAEVSLHQIFSDRAVLQRDQAVPVWGWAAPGEEVSVSFAGQTHQATADAMGRWEVVLTPLQASKEGRDLVARGASNEIVCHDVVVGEVWMLLGDHTIRNRFMKRGDTGESGDNLRITTIMPRHDCRYPADQANATVWMSDGVQQSMPLYLGQQLERSLEVPVGIVLVASTGVITPFLSVEGVKSVKELGYLLPLTAETDPATPTGKRAYTRYREEDQSWLKSSRLRLRQDVPLELPPVTPQTDHSAFDEGNNGEWNVGAAFNPMVHPLRRLAVRGAVAFFGEYNSRFGATGGYDHRIAFGPKCVAFVQSLRLLRNEPELPIYFRGVGPGSPVHEAMRAAQLNALGNIPHVRVIASSKDERRDMDLMSHLVLSECYGAKVDEQEVQAALTIPPPKAAIDPEAGTGFDSKVFGVPSRSREQKPASPPATLRLPFVFASNGVLQRDREVPIWGWATPGHRVTVSFAGVSREARADLVGRWQVKLPPMPVNAQGQVLTVTDGVETLTLASILIGDVWLCSGQSNMAMRLKDTLDAKAVIAASANPLIRHMRVDSDAAITPAEDVVVGKSPGEPWSICGPDQAGEYSAVATYFAKELVAQTGVPIGLINSSLGGSRIEPWIAPQGYERVAPLAELARQASANAPASPAYRAAREQQFTQIQGWLTACDSYLNESRVPPPLPEIILPVRTDSLSYADPRPSVLYNGKIYGLIPYAIRGAIWYQGESNGSEGESYFHKLQALIEGWRAVWDQGNFPFYVVQLPNFGKAAGDFAHGSGWARIREAQAKILALPNTGLAVTIDIGDARNIHPKNKLDVGRRLARWALHDVYNQDALVPGSPMYASSTVEGSAIRIRFANAQSGLIIGAKQGMEPVEEVKDGTLIGFAIAGNDQKFVPATATVNGDSVLVSAEGIAKPIAIRYAFTGNPQGANLYNRDGLPAAPFRTDSW